MFSDNRYLSCRKGEKEKEERAREEAREGERESDRDKQQGVHRCTMTIIIPIQISELRSNISLVTSTLNAGVQPINDIQTIRRRERETGDPFIVRACA